MQVTEVRLTKAPPEDSCLAYGSVTFDGDFVVCGIRVLKNKVKFQSEFVIYTKH